MSIIIILGLIFLISSSIMLFAKQYGKIFPIVNCISITLLLGYLILGVAIRLSCNFQRAEYITLKNSIQDLRKEEGKLQSTYVTLEIIEANKKLAKMKYLNNTSVGIFIPESFVKLNFLK